MSTIDRPLDPTDIDPAYDGFLELFNQGRFWESHEALEGSWREHGSEFYHALILYASAFVHVNRGNRHGIAAQLGKAQPLLESRRPHYLGLDVDGMLEHAAVCRHIVAENREAPEEAWDVLIPMPRLVFRPERVRGDEPELTGEWRRGRNGEADDPASDAAGRAETAEPAVEGEG